MKRYIGITLSLVMFVAPLSAREFDNCRPRKCNKYNNCDNVIAITQKDIGTSGYVIDEPGHYCLAEDVVFSPANPATFNPVIITDATGSGAQGLAAVSNGVVRGIFTVNGGSNYSNPSVTILGSGTGATATAQISGGAITGFTVTNGGLNYKQDLRIKTLKDSCWSNES